MCVVEDEPDLSLEEGVSSKTYRMTLTVVWVDSKKETVDVDKTNSIKENSMKDDIEKYAELTEVYNAAPNVFFIYTMVYPLEPSLSYSICMLKDNYWAPLYGSHVVARMLQAN